MGDWFWNIYIIRNSYFLKSKYDLGEMTNSQIFRIGIVIGLLTYIFLWTVIFNFIVAN